MTRCLFLAPLKPPDHPVPSGDRTIAGLMMRLIARLGYSVELASRLMTRIAEPVPEAFKAIETRAEAELGRLFEAERRAAEPASVVFCYHQFYRAPDLIGPRLAASLAIPYVIAEASRAPKHADGPFARWHARSEAACDAARLILTPSALDRVMLDRLKPAGQVIADLKPFIDPADWPCVAEAADAAASKDAEPARLLSIGMMRPGNKLESYRALAAALALVRDIPWRLTIVGDGAARGEVEALFAPFTNRVNFAGAIGDRALLGRHYRAADLFVWPAIREPLGMVFLEAAAHGLPSLAGAGRSVADVVRHGQSGLIVPEGDIEGFAGALAGLIADPARRKTLSASARRFALGERGIEPAAASLREAFASIGIVMPTVPDRRPA